MPRTSKGSKMPQRQSLRDVHQVRPSKSDSYALYHRPITDRSGLKVGDRHARRGTPRSDLPNQKKLGTRITDLETQLGQAQQELKILKDQMASAKAAKKEAQEQMEEKTEKPKAPEESRDSNKIDSLGDEVPEGGQRETDVSEAPLEKVVMKPKVKTSADPTKVLEVEKPLNDLALKDGEINVLKSKLEEKENEVIVFRQENEDLKTQLNELTLNISTAKANKVEMRISLRQIKEELEANKTMAAQLKEKLRSVEGKKEALEEEMKKLRAQTEQWRKAADAAAAILCCGGEETNGRLSNRCSSMDEKHFGGMFELPAGGYTGYVGSFGLDDEDNGCRTGKQKGSGIKLFGDLWKKKGHK